MILDIIETASRALFHSIETDFATSPSTRNDENKASQDVYSRFLFVSISFFLLFCALPYLVLIFIFFINSLVFPSGLIDAYRNGAFLFFIAGLGGFLGVFTKFAKRLIEWPDKTIDEFKPLLKRLALNYLIGMIVGAVALCLLKTRTLVALVYSNKFEGLPDPTEHAVFLVALVCGMFSTELLSRADGEVSARLKSSKTEIPKVPDELGPEKKPKGD